MSSSIPTAADWCDGMSTSCTAAPNVR